MSREVKRLLGKQWNRQLANQPKRKTKMKRTIDSYRNGEPSSSDSWMDSSNDLYDDYSYPGTDWDDLDDVDFIDDLEDEYDEELEDF